MGNRRVLTESLVGTSDLLTGTYLENDGLVVLEAENFASTITTTHSWVTATAQSGYVGTAYLQGVPDIDTLYAEAALATSPTADYSLYITTPETYTIWLRGYAPNGAGDSVYVGLNAVITAVTGFAPGAWSWAGVTVAGGSPALPISSTGVYSLNLWLREDGLRLDRLLLTTDTNYIPTGDGPAESERYIDGEPLPLYPLARTIVYTYDQLYRLTEADYTTGENYQYDYDAVGNRLEQIIAGDTTTYQYDEANRLEAVIHLGQTQPYTYSANGNLLQTGVMTNSFDAANRLITSNRDSVTVQPIYNGVGDRVGQTVGATTTHYALDVEGLPEVIYTSEGNAYLHLPGVIVAESSTGETRYLLGDGLGSVRQAVDETGAVVAYNEFDPYGNPVQNGSQPYGFTGEWWQAEVELLHLRARWLMPETGTFLSRDPVESEPPYQYVRGNPINNTDPSGLCVPDDLICWATYERILQLCPECADLGLHDKDTEFLRRILDNLTKSSSPPPSAYRNQIEDPLTEQQWNLAKQEARRFGLPKELVASTIAAEIVYDTDWVNTAYDYSTGAVGIVADYAYMRRDRPLFDLCYGLLESFHEYFGLAPYLEPKGIGYGAAPGIAHMHAGPAVRTENYINKTYPGQNLLPDLGPQNQEGVRLRTLLSDEGSIRYAAAYLRWWADMRKDSTSDHTADLTDTDMIIIYTVYRCSVRDCYGNSMEEFQNTQKPSPWGHPNDFAVFLPIYKNKP